MCWYLGDRLLEETARISVEVNEGWSYLKVKNVNPRDAGLYKVTAENVAGIDEASFDVLVKGIWVHVFLRYTGDTSLLI